MSRSYLIGVSLEDQIQQSGLLTKYPELLKNPIKGHFTDSELEKDIICNPLSIPLIIQNRIFRTLGEFSPWKIVYKDTKGGNLFGEAIQNVPTSPYDLALGTGYLLPNSEDDEEYGEEKEFDKSELLKFQEYGFSSMLEMIMSVSAYRSREIMKWQNDQYEWVNSRGIRNVITACVHGDPKFLQYQEGINGEVYSPYGNKVEFVPRKQIGAMTQVHHSHEPGFFATFFRYAYECGKLKEIMGDNGEKFIKGADNLLGMLGNFGDAGMGSYMDSSEMMWRVCIPIGGNNKFRNIHKEGFGPNYNGEQNSYYEFRISNEGNLELFNAYTGLIDMIYYPEDCEDLLKGILHQCANGHGRTSKTQILDLVRYVYSDQIIEDIKDLSDLEIPIL